MRRRCGGWAIRSARHGLDVHVEGSGDVRSLDLEYKVLLFQGVRELLTNAVKHAKANLAKVEIEVGETEVRVVVQDDGVGLGPVERQPSERVWPRSTCVSGWNTWAGGSRRRRRRGRGSGRR